MWVFDATPLIYLAKAEQLGIVAALEKRCVLPGSVYEEVVEAGIEQGYPDACRVEHAVKDGTLAVVEVEETPLLGRLREADGLTTADASVLACAATHDGVAVMDESYGRNIAAAEGIETRGTAYLVLLAVKRGTIDAEAGREAIDSMLDTGWYCSPDVYGKVVQKLESFE